MRPITPRTISGSRARRRGLCTAAAAATVTGESPVGRLPRTVPPRDGSTSKTATAFVSALLALTTFGLAGCAGSTAPPPFGEAIVVGSHANGSWIDRATLASPALSGDLAAAVAAQATVTVIRDDGAPAALFDHALIVTGRSSTIRTRQAQQNRATLEAAVASVRPAEAEVDTLAALNEAGRAVAGQALPRITLIDSGLQTRAPLAFQDGLLDSAGDVSGVVTAILRRTGELPDLTGVAVSWYDIGATDPPQKPLTIAELARLQKIWQAILTAAGATSVTFVTQPLPVGIPPAGLPVVTVIPVGAPSAITVAAPASSGTTPAATPRPVPAPILVTRLDDTATHFLPDQAVLVDPRAAEDNLGTLAIKLLAGHYTHIDVAGTCALACSGLDVRRASVVRNLLVQLGVPADRFGPVRGLGTHFAGWVPDRSSDGSLIEKYARLDRLVIVSAA
jgi:hypothetical protein